MISERDVPLVAILTPVYNGERFLDETMRCVQASDYPNLVHVILDNASTDATPAIIERHKGGRVPIISRRNPYTISLNDNFNAVATMTPAEARYVRTLCADDLMASSAISRMVDIAERDESVTIVGCQCRDVGIMGSELPDDQAVFPGATIVRAYLRRETMVLSGTHFLLRRTAFQNCQFPYDPILISADADCAIRVSLTGAFGFVHEPLALFRHHDESHSARVAVRNGDFLFEWLLVLDRYAAKVLSPAEYAQCRRLYRRYFLRRSLLAGLRQGDWRFFTLQLQRLAECGDPAGVGDFAGALAEWAYFAATGQRSRVGAPRAPVVFARTRQARPGRLQ